jgi:hypothetical protein
MQSFALIKCSFFCGANLFLQRFECKAMLCIQNVAKKEAYSIAISYTRPLKS